MREESDMAKDVLFPGRGYRGDDMVERVKTDMRMPRGLVDWIEEVCKALGVSKNAFFSMAGAALAMKFVPLFPGAKRQKLFKELKRFMLQVLDETESSL